MEIFIPSLVVFFVALAIAFLLAPRATPIIAAILSMIFLSYGIYDHYQMFEAEYRLSTWHEGLKIYAPAIMILAVLLFIIMSSFVFFTSGKVSVPSLPSINTVTENVTNVVANVTNTLTNAASNVVNTANQAMDTVAQNVNRGNATANTTKTNKSNISRSFLETI